MMRQFALTLCCIAFTLTTNALERSHTPALSHFELHDANLTYAVNQYARMSTEKTESWSVEEAFERFDQFEQLAHQNYNYGFHEQGVWFHIPIINHSSVRHWTLDIGYTQLDHVAFYLLHKGKVIAQGQQGKLHGDQVARYPSFHFELTTAQPHDVLIRIDSPNHIILAPFELQSSDHFYRAISLEQAVWGIFYGGLLMLLLYNLILFMTTRDITLLVFLAVLITALSFELLWSGYSQFFFENTFVQWLSRHVETGFILSTLCAGVFTQLFLETGNRISRINRLIGASFIVQIVVSGLTSSKALSVSNEHVTIYAVCFASMCLYFYASLVSYLKHYSPAKFLTLAWGIMVCASFFAIIAKITLIPPSFFTDYCLQGGVFITTALFSVALVEKRRVQLESEVANATEDLVNNLELFEEQNARLDIARKDAIKASHVKSQFLANISHEIRTPLNAILGFSRELLALALPPEKGEHIQIINTSASNLLAIVNDVLDFSKIEAGKLRIIPESFSPNDLLEEVVILYTRMANEKGLTFAYQRTPLPEKLIGDPVRIKQVLTNLISNAIKFTQRGHVLLIVKSTKTKNRKINLHFSVEDTGIGIQNKDKQKLFHSFSQLDEALNRSYHGTGLGLVISQQLVKLMRGRIYYDSIYGIGSQFHMLLRCAINSETDDITSNSPWQKKSLVIYDSNPITRQANAMLFNQLGAHITCVESPDFLLSLQASYDALIVDSTTLDRSQRPTLLRICQTFQAKDKILLHDGKQARDAKPERQKVFNRFIETPLALARLNASQSDTQIDDANIWQHRLASLPAINVLAVDDMELNLKLLKTWLADSPINLVLSNSGKNALNLCQYLDFDLILMDVQMPDMDGVETTKRIRKTKINQGTPIIAVTAHAFREEKERLLNSGLDDYLAKPLDLAALINTIKRWSVGAGEDQQPIKCDLNDIDWQQAVDKANGNKALANDLFYEFIQQLDNAYRCIAEHAEVEEWHKVEHYVHRLHGVSCYTGVPKLQYLLAECEKNLKMGEFALASRYIPTIKDTVDELLNHQSSVHT